IRATFCERASLRALFFLFNHTPGQVSTHEAAVTSLSGRNHLLLLRFPRVSKDFRLLCKIALILLFWPAEALPRSIQTQNTPLPGASFMFAHTFIPQRRKFSHGRRLCAAALGVLIL